MSFRFVVANLDNVENWIWGKEQTNSDQKYGRKSKTSWSQCHCALPSQIFRSCVPESSCYQERYHVFPAEVWMDAFQLLSWVHQWFFKNLWCILRKSSAVLRVATTNDHSQSYIVTTRWDNELVRDRYNDETKTDPVKLRNKIDLFLSNTFLSQCQSISEWDSHIWLAETKEAHGAGLLSEHFDKPMICADKFKNYQMQDGSIRRRRN